MKNPFVFKELPIDAPFCDREKELKDLVSHAANNSNVVLFSPRRYGKTSLTKRVQAQLVQNGFIAVYIDFFGVDSTEDVAARLASQLYAFCHKNESMFQKAMRLMSSWRPVIKPDSYDGLSISVEPVGHKKGMDVLDETLSQFGKLVAESDIQFHVVFDEFQEITELPDSIKVEGLMRSHMQTHQNVSYFFVGSRRRILVDIFNEKKRPFYKSAISCRLPPLPKDEATVFIIERFSSGGKKCPEDIAEMIFNSVNGYPYYIQRIPYSIYEVSEKETITRDDYVRGALQTMEDEKTIYEALIGSLSIQHIKLFSALSRESTASPFSANYMARHGLGSVGGVQGALKKLINLDYIEKGEDGVFCVVDPMFALWLNHLKKV
ncbi:MAG: ATP-binding protein [Syntrophus sp. (in: bacteria)]|nr:ATP-binding protein [Syntrophus sp. (in: bacteria)]